MGGGPVSGGLVKEALRSDISGVRDQHCGVWKRRTRAQGQPEDPGVGCARE